MGQPEIRSFSLAMDRFAFRMITKSLINTYTLKILEICRSSTMLSQEMKNDITRARELFLHCKTKIMNLS